jgi:hypothetical protein
MGKKPVNDAGLDPEQIDALYGLEPVLEPGTESQSGSELTTLVSVSCPYCGDSFATVLDLSAGSSSYIEDCQVCCQPIELRVTVDADGNLREMVPARTD